MFVPLHSYTPKGKKKHTFLFLIKTVVILAANTYTAVSTSLFACSSLIFYLPTLLLTMLMLLLLLLQSP